MKIVRVLPDSIIIKDFLSLPKMLYTKQDNMENEKEVEKLITGTHVLSKYFEVYPYVCYSSENKVVGRFMMTVYPDDDILYFGLFECINDNIVAKFIFDFVYKYGKDNHFKKIIGPVDASFWIKYRLKVNKFNIRPYTGEPYNKDYYLDLFLNNGFNISERYLSNIYNIVSDDYINEKFKKRVEKCKVSGYVIKSPLPKDFDRVLDEVYYLITELYKDFPVYKHIEKEDFKNIFDSFRQIVNYSMVKMAYYNEEPVGFFISIPNYNNLVYNLNAINITRILGIKKKPTEFVMLYMGALRKHLGVGAAMSYLIVEELRKSKLPSIGALIKEGKVTQGYIGDLVDSRYEYVLLEKDIV